MLLSTLSALVFAGAAHAWLPHDRDLAAFNQTARFEQLGKRFTPSLPSGVTKIRGVNFGGT
jgi:glucan endo-1,6-beta-glucosidase